jgi:zinc protease
MMNHSCVFPLRRAAYIASALAAVALVASVSAARGAPVPVFDRKSVHFWRLESGLRIVVKEDHSAPVVAVNVVIRAGSRRETAANNGISHFVEHMIFRGARAGDVDAFGAAIEAVGGVVNGGTLRDFTHFSAVTPARHLDLALGALAKALLHPRFDPEAIAAERLVLVHEAAQLADQPHVAIWDLAFKTAYGTHPYGLPISGSAASLVGIDDDALNAFYHTWYVANNASVVIVGDVAPEAARAAAAHAFAGWRRGTTAQGPPPPAPEGPRAHVEPRSLTQATVLMGFIVAGMSRPRDVCAVDLLYTIVGEGYTSPLRRALVDSKLADEVNVNFLTQALPGLFGIQVTCAPQRVDEVRRALEREAAKLGAAPVGDEELAKAKDRLGRSYVFSNETFEEQASTLGFYEAIATYEFGLDYLDQVWSLTGAEVQAAAARYLDPRRAIWVAIIPREGSEPATKAVSAQGDAR